MVLFCPGVPCDPLKIPAKQALIPLKISNELINNNT
jgi:hypothetical protein